jgi:hypothetical protein
MVLHRTIPPQTGQILPNLQSTCNQVTIVKSVYLMVNENIQLVV